MKIAPYVEKLHLSSQYKHFRTEHPDSFMVAGFFVLDFETNKHIHQLDYYVPKEKKVAAFTLDQGITLQMLELMKNEVPEQLDYQTKLDLFALKGVLQEEMHNRMMTEDIKKIIAVLQTIQGKRIWSLNCVLSGMGILKASVEDASQTVLKMEKSSIMDYLKKVPGSALQQAVKQSQDKQGTNLPSPSKEELEHEMQKLDALEKKIEDAKKELNTQIQAEKK